MHEILLLHVWAWPLFCCFFLLLHHWLPSGWQQQEPCALARQCVDTIVANVVRGAEYRHAHVGRGQCVARTRRRNHLHNAVSATFAKKRKDPTVEKFCRKKCWDFLRACLLDGWTLILIGWFLFVKFVFFFWQVWWNGVLREQQSNSGGGKECQGWSGVAPSWHSIVDPKEKRDGTKGAGGGFCEKFRTEPWTGNVGKQHVEIGGKVQRTLVLETCIL